LLLLNYFQEHYGKDFLKNCEKLKLIPAINIPNSPIEHLVYTQKISTGEFYIGNRVVYITQVEKKIQINPNSERYIISRYNDLSSTKLDTRYKYEDEEPYSVSDEDEVD
jgi:hypothetical protein